MKKSKGQISGWRRVVDGCPQRAQHLYESVVARIADHGECRLDYDEAGVGLNAILGCLQHTFAMTSDDVEELRSEVEFVLDPYGSWKPSPSSPELPQYPGGHPRITSGEHEGEFYPVWDLGELVESRGEELADRRTAPGGVRVDFEIERPEGYVPSEGMMGQMEFEWSLDVGAEQIGDAGYWVMRYYNGDNERDIDAAIGAWSPFDDAEASRSAFLAAFPRFWDQFESYTMGAESWRFSTTDPFIVDAIAHECSEPDVGGWLHRVAVFACERASERAHLEEALWHAYGCQPPSDRWWDAPSVDQATLRGLDNLVVRQLAAFYVMVSLEQVLDSPEREASTDD